MKKLNKNEQGFSAVEIVLVVVIVVLIGVVGYMVYKNHHKSKTADSATTSSSVKPPSTIKTSNATKQPVDPYAGWKSYTLQYEKLTLRYPSNWTVSDQSTAAGKHDTVTLNGPGNFSFDIDDGIQNGGDPLSLANNDPVALTYLGNPVYMVFVHPKVPQADGPSVPDTSVVSGAMMLTNANNQASFPVDKNVMGSSQYNGVNGPEGSYMAFAMGYSGKDNMPLAAAKADTQYGNSRLVIQSMHY